MNLNIVSQYLLSNEPAKFAEALSNPDPNVLDKARELYVARHGRLPSPPLPERPQPSKTFQVFVFEFSGGMRDFFSHYHDKDAEEAFNSRSWAELQVEATKALTAFDAHNQRRSSWRNPFEAADKAAGAVARRIEFLMELIPDGDYTGILTGGLRLLYNTARRKKEVRNKIFEALDSLCDTISHTKAEIRLYSNNQDLRDKSETLYMAILDFVRAVVAYLDKNSAFQSFKAFFQQDRYGSKIDNDVDAIKAASASFEKSVSVCFQRRIQKIDDNVENLKNPIFGIFFLLAGILKDFPSQLDQLKADMLKAANMHVMQLMTQPVAPPSISTQHLQQLLSVGDWQTGVASATEGLHRARSFVPSPLDQEKLGLLMSNYQFITWIKSLASGFIILHDEAALQRNSSLSILSHLSAIIPEILRVPGMFPLTFFCGLYCTAGNLLEGGHGIMRSLALQLLPELKGANLNPPCDPSFIIQGLMMNDLATLRSIFTLLLQNIPAGLVYVIIDGACWYATEARSEDMQAVILFLYQLALEVHAASRGLVLKVMVTNPTSRQRNSWGFGPCDVYLDQTLLAGGHQGRIR